MSKAGQIGCIILGVLLAVLFIWFGTWKAQIPFNFSSFGSFMYWTITLMIAGFVILAGIFGGEDSNETAGFAIAGTIVIVWVLAFIILLFMTSKAFHARAYASQLEIPEATPFTESDIPVFDPTQIPWVSEQQAQVLGDKVIGQLGSIGSSTTIGEYVRQEVGGKLYFVAPILHSGYWKYNSNQSGTPGFIMVSMTNDEDVRLVTENSSGEKIKLRVQPGGHAAFGDKLERIVYNLDPNAIICEKKFEVDDELNPYWVVSIKKNEIGWGGADIDRVIVVSATNGSAKSYAVNEVPEWVDRIYSVKLIEKQLANWGKYKGGYMNSMFAKTDLLQSDEGDAIVYVDGDCYVFDSLTSYGGSDESTVGFVLVNLRTKEVRHFSLAGATEWAAQQSALGDERVKAQNYRATFPLPTMIEGKPAYFMALEDPNSSIAKSFAIVNMEKHQIVGIGTTPAAAKADYLTKLRSSGSTSLNTPSANLIEITGKVVRWGPYSQSGNTYYQFVIEGHEDRLLVTDSSSLEAAITREGDRVTVRVMSTTESVWSVFSFDNLEFNQTQSETEKTVTKQEMEQKLQEVKDNPNMMDDSKFKDWWNNLSPAEREAFLNNLDQ